MFNAIAQMTPYGIYDLKYTDKNYSSNKTKKSTALPKAAKVYDSVAIPFFLKKSAIVANTSALHSKYKKDIFTVTSSARALRDSAERLLQENWPKPKLEAPAGITAQFADDVKYKDYNVDVVQLAKNHSFKTKALDVSGNIHLEKGTYSVIVEKDNKQQKAAFTLSNNASVREVMYKLVDALNSFSKDVYAETDEEDGGIMLSVNATASGKEGRFAIYDDTGDVLQRLGLYPDRLGEDGNVRINGTDYPNKNNTVVLEEGKLNLSFSKEVRSRISVVPDAQQSVYAIKALANNYNNFMSDFSNADNTTNLVGEMFGAFANLFASRPENNDLGISLSPDNNLFVFDEQLCTKYLQANPLAIERIKDGNKSVSSALYNMADGLAKNPLNTYFSSLAISGNEPVKFSGIVIDLLA